MKKTILIIVIIILILMGLFSFLKKFKGPVYDPDDARAFIHGRMTSDERQRISEGDVLYVIEAEFKYLQEKGEINDATINYIQGDGKNKGKNYSKDDILKIFALEEEYMKSIGIEIQDIK